MKLKTFAILPLALTTTFFITPASTQDAVPSKEQVARVHTTPQFSPYAGRSFPTKVLFGDSHLHTDISVDDIDPLLLCYG